MATTQTKGKAVGNPLKEKRLRVKASIDVNFITNVPANIDEETFAREVVVLIRGFAASAPINITEVSEAESTGKRAYTAKVVGQDGGTVFEGIVVSKDKDEAKKVLSTWKKTRPDLAKGRCEVEVPFMESAGIPTSKQIGVYAELDFTKFEP